MRSSRRAEGAGAYENPDGWRHLPLLDQGVHGGRELGIEAVLAYEEASLFRGVDLGRDVDPVAADGSWIDAAAVEKAFDDAPLRTAIVNG